MCLFCSGGPCINIIIPMHEYHAFNARGGGGGGEGGGTTQSGKGYQLHLGPVGIMSQHD